VKLRNLSIILASMMGTGISMLMVFRCRIWVSRR